MIKKLISVTGMSAILVLLLCPLSIPGEMGFNRISNDIGIYRNTDDNLSGKGWTLQLVLINTIRAGTDFQIEFTGDFNRDLAWNGKDDYYIEIGILKELYRGFSLNYQRIEGTFQTGGINQVGLRYHF